MPEDKKVKFTEDEISKVQDIQKQYIQIQTDLGQIAIARLRLRNQLDGLDVTETDLMGQFSEVQGNEKTFVDSVREKYGDGTLDPTTGEYTKNISK